MIVSASWNGATKVTKWRARSGTQPGALQGAVEADRSGFETTLQIQGTPEYVVAEALDATGERAGHLGGHPGTRRQLSAGEAGRVPRGSTAQRLAGREHHAGGRKRGVDQGEEADEPDRPLRHDDQHEAGQGDHGAVVADQLDQPDRQ